MSEQLLGVRPLLQVVLPQEVVIRGSSKSPFVVLEVGQLLPGGLDQPAAKKQNQIAQLGSSSTPQVGWACLQSVPHHNYDHYYNVYCTTHRSSLHEVLRNPGVPLVGPGRGPVMILTRIKRRHAFNMMYHQGWCHV